MAVAILPAHEMVLDERGIEVAFLSALFSFMRLMIVYPAAIVLKFMDYRIVVQQMLLRALVICPE